MTWRSDAPGDADDVDERLSSPLDPDLDQSEDRRHRPEPERATADDSPSPFRPQRRRALPRIHGRVVTAVAVGGFFGGLLRYAVSLALPAGDGGFPWAVFAVNTGGAFFLGLLLILVLDVLPPTTYVRPLLGTGFCGALTTFSSVATGVDQLIARGSALTAVGYLLGSLLAGLGAAWLGIVLGRSVAAVRQRRS